MAVSLNPTYSCTGGCLGETMDGSCPTFAASTGGVMGDWDVSKVTTMEDSTSTSVSTLFVHWTVSLICFFDLFLIHPLLFVFCILSCPPPFLCPLLSAFRVVGSVSGS